jgi:hypothetical protein
MKMSMNGHGLRSLPSLYGSHIPIEVASNLLPGVESAAFSNEQFRFLFIDSSGVSDV